MIVIFEHDKRNHGKGGFMWRPAHFKDWWRGTKFTHRVCWGLWSISTYPEPGLKDFMDYIKVGNTEWRDDR